MNTSQPKERYVVFIIEAATNAKTWASKPTDKRSAERIERGANINLDHSKYFTTIEKELK